MTPPLTAKEKKERKATADAAKLAKATEAARVLEEAALNAAPSVSGSERRGNREGILTLLIRIG